MVQPVAIFQCAQMRLFNAVKKLHRSLHLSLLGLDNVIAQYGDSLCLCRIIMLQQYLQWRFCTELLCAAQGLGKLLLVLIYRVLCLLFVSASAIEICHNSSIISHSERRRHRGLFRECSCMMQSVACTAGDVWPDKA